MKFQAQFYVTNHTLLLKSDVSEIYTWGQLEQLFIEEGG